MALDGELHPRGLAGVVEVPLDLRVELALHRRVDRCGNRDQVRLDRRTAELGVEYVTALPEAPADAETLEHVPGATERFTARRRPAGRVVAAAGEQELDRHVGRRRG
jgi:hypothetical protein